MSHIATVDVQIKDLSSLQKACEKLGLELVKGQTNFKWYGRFVGDSVQFVESLRAKGINVNDYGKCDHVIRVKDASRHTYEIGVVKLADGTYTLLWDYFQGGFGLMDKVAADSDKAKEGVGKLVQRYATEVAAKRLKQQGYRVTETVVDGKIKLKATR